MSDATRSRPSRLAGLVRGRRDPGSAYGVDSDVVSADGTRIHAWRNGGDGPAVLLAPGLGTLPEAWPRLVDPGCGLDVASWYQRGTFGSARPTDPGAVTIDDHVEDALAVLQAADLHRVVVAGWSMGVNIAFELALRAPERVAGIVGVAGVPGSTFATIGDPLRVPRAVRAPGARLVARSLGWMGPGLTAVATRAPVTRELTRSLQRARFLGRSVDVEAVTRMLRRFALQDWRWYMHLALSFADHTVADLTGVTCPVTLLSGTRDVLTSAKDVAAVAQLVPQATVRELDATHFLPLEYADECFEAVRDMVERTVLP